MKQARLWFVFAVLPLFGIAQPQRRIEGQILNSATGDPVAFASIAVERTNYGTSSNDVGRFVFVLPTHSANRDFVLTITSLGFETSRVKNPSDTITIWLKPSTIELREVVVYAKDQNARRIVSKAFSRVKKNYQTKPFLYKSFYRHYCKDDTTYGRLIEAAVDIYKRKGYKLVQPKPGYKEEVRVTQLRRSFDNTSMRSHAPIALYSAMGADPVAYQNKSAPANEIVALFMNQYNVSNLKRQIKNYEFEFDGITSYDGSEVFKIKYTRHFKRDFTSGPPFESLENGTLFINTRDYAILRSEFTNYRLADTVIAMTIYKRVGDKYYHHYTMKEGRNFYPAFNIKHTFTVELMTSDIVLKDFQTFKGKEPDKEAMLKIEYDSSFWDSYNILKATPLQEQIALHLQKDLGLENQYSQFQKIERERFLAGKEDEGSFNKHLLVMRGIRPVYIFMWEAGCEECVRQIPRLKRIVEMYKTKMSFVMVSFDKDVDAWRKMTKKYGLSELPIRNYRFGLDADAIKSFSVTEVPRCILVDKQGLFVNLSAKMPADFSLIKDFEDLLSKKDN